MKKNHKVELDEAEKRLSDKMTALFDDEIMPKGEQRKQMDALLRERGELSKAFVEKHTQEWVNQHIT